MSEKIRVLIATPMVHSLAKGGYISTVFSINNLLRERGIAVDFSFLECSDVVSGRNSMATYFLENTKHSHLLFIDSDMEFDAKVILRMIEFGAQLSAVACPRRNIDLELLVSRAQAAAQKSEPFDLNRAVAEQARYNLRYTWDIKSEVKLNTKDGFIDVAGIGTGVMLISRFVLETMVNRGVAKKRYIIQRDGSITDKFVYGFFDVIYPNENTNFYSEDYSFCYRWTKTLEQKIWALIDAKIKHIGDYAFEGNYIDHLQANRF